MKRLTITYVLCWSVSLLLFTGGCSNETDYVDVHGKVYYNDKPLTSGVIMFQPRNGPPARGTIQPDGSFQLNIIGKDVGARIGLNKVRIASRKPPVEGPLEPSLGPLITPKKYDSFVTSGLTAEVKAEGNEPFVFHLKD